MLFALSLSYIVMNSPSHVTRLYYLLASPRGGLLGGETAVEGSTDADDLLLSDGSGASDESMLGGSGDYVADAEAGDTMLSEEAGLVQLVLLYTSYSYYAVKFILFLSFSKNFRRSIRDSCSDGFSAPCLKRQTEPTAV
ncbi:hypothetical protein BaRGS_00037347 [Batillaria attramentaria]|uniref:Uncharacterized protein n=1 Tax=Batillaria attramentaria TaxID=370345 RepID=A0ABD0J8Y5_9CAEN